MTARKLIPKHKAIETLHYVSFKVSVPVGAEKYVLSPGFFTDDVSARLFERYSKKSKN